MSLPTVTDALAIVGVANSSGSSTPYNYITPKKVYTLLNDENTSRQLSIPLYLTHFLNGFKSQPPLKFVESGKERVVLFSPLTGDDGNTLTPNAIDTYQQTFNIDGNNQYQNIAFTVEQKSVKASVVRSSLNTCLCIGDSITDGTSAYADVPSGAAGVYHSVAVEELMKLRIDAGDNSAYYRHVNVGTKLKTWSLTYGSVSNRTMRSCYEGRGGWLLSTYLFWSVNWSSPKSQGFYDLLGLGNGTGTDYTGAIAQVQAIFTTPEGKYTPKNTSAFIACINAQFSTSYTTYSQCTTALSAKQSAPDNPFYDYSVASGSGSVVAFSMTTYISRYKTLSSDGVTRLVVGSTAGSLVTDATAYDVLVPRSVWIQLSTNDGDVSWIGTNMQLLVNQIKAEYTANSWGAVKIAISIVNSAGTYFPTHYPAFDRNSISIWQYPLATQQFNNMGRIFSQFYTTSAAEDTNGVYIMPQYFIAPTAWGYDVRDVPTPEYQITGQLEHAYKKGTGTGPNYHPNGICHRVWGTSMAAWLLYSLNF